VDFCITGTGTGFARPFWEGEERRGRTGGGGDGGSRDVWSGVSELMLSWWEGGCFDCWHWFFFWPKRGGRRSSNLVITATQSNLRDHNLDLGTCNSKIRQLYS